VSGSRTNRVIGTPEISFDSKVPVEIPGDGGFPTIEALATIRDALAIDCAVAIVQILIPAEDLGLGIVLCP
jgi:hypothetical protein